MTNSWSVDEYQTVFDDYSIHGDAILDNINGRAPLTVKNKAQTLGQLPPRRLTEEESRFINEHGKSLGKATSLFIFGHSPKEIASIINSN